MKESAVLYSVQVAGPPTCLHLFGNDGGQNGDEVVYGTVDGKVGLVKLGRQGSQDFWLMDPSADRTLAGQGYPNTMSSPSTSAVLSMDYYDLTGDGVKELIVGKHDGTIEVYAHQDGEDGEPVLKHSMVRSRESM